MLSAIIDTNQAQSDAGEGLARTIAALVPAVAQGVVRDGWIIGGEEGGPEEQIADAAGCGWIGGDLSAALPQAVEGSDGTWLLLLEAGCAPEPGWWQEAGEFVGRAALLPAENCPAATFGLADPRYSLAGRISEWATTLRGAVTGRPASAQGLIVRRQLVERQLAKLQLYRFPPRLSVRAKRLRARITASPSRGK